MKKIKKLYAFFVIIAIPIFVFTAALNITFRAPEVYSYYFNESQAIDYTTLALTSNQLADQIAGFANDFFGDEVEIVENAGYQDDPVFNDEEAEILFELRSILSKTLLLMLIALAVGIPSYVLLVRREEEKLLFFSCQIGIAISTVVTIISGIMFRLSRFRAMLYQNYVDISLPKDSVLKILFTKGNFWGTCDIVYVAMAIIILLAVLYVSWRLTKPYKIFK